jgi:Family of unknown function (DUF6221)
MTDIAAFLNARLREDEAAAKAAAPGPWHGHEAGSLRAVLPAKGIGPDTAVVEHIARHDPARVLREVAAKRAILEFYVEPPDGLPAGDSEVISGVAEAGSSRPPRLFSVIELIVLDLAAVWNDHADYDPAWAAAATQR